METLSRNPVDATDLHRHAGTRDRMAELGVDHAVSWVAVFAGAAAAAALSLVLLLLGTGLGLAPSRLGHGKELALVRLASLPLSGCR